MDTKKLKKKLTKTVKSATKYAKKKVQEIDTEKIKKIFLLLQMQLQKQQKQLLTKQRKYLRKQLIVLKKM